MEGDGLRGSPRWLLLALVLAAAGLSAGAARGDAPQPSPTLSPQAVVRIQLEALRHNDAADSGIAVAFRFASPANRRMTGPEPRFARMIRQGPYSLMLRYSHASFGPLTVSGREALQPVTLVAPGEAPVTYLFHLSRQTDAGPLEDCWMTESVQVVPQPGTAA